MTTNDLVVILERLQHSMQAQLAQYEASGCKLYILGPGGASIDGIPQFLVALRQQSAGIDQALTIARQLA